MGRRPDPDRPGRHASKLSGPANPHTGHTTQPRVPGYFEGLTQQLEFRQAVHEGGKSLFQLGSRQDLTDAAVRPAAKYKVAARVIGSPEVTWPSGPFAVMSGLNFVQCTPPSTVLCTYCDP